MPRSSVQWFQIVKLAVTLIVFGLVIAGIAAAAIQSSSPSKPAPVMRKPPEGLPDFMTDPKAGDAAVTRLANKSHGDYDRLTPAEQEFVDGMSAGHGPQMILMRFQGQGTARSAKKK